MSMPLSTSQHERSWSPQTPNSTTGMMPLKAVINLSHAKHCSGCHNEISQGETLYV